MLSVVFVHEYTTALGQRKRKKQWSSSSGCAHYLSNQKKNEANIFGVPGAPGGVDVLTGR